MNDADFWDNQEAAKSVVAELKVLKAVTEPIESLFRGIDDTRALYQLAEEAGDAESLEEADRMLTDLEKKGEKVELQTLLDGKNDHRNAFFTIQAGAGGTEAQDWAEMLARMYLYFWEKRGWDVSEVDRQYGEQAGIKSATFLVKGDYAFGYMRVEAGVHRLVRPSPFNAQGKRQTSFASLDVTPEFTDADEEVDIPETDLDFVAFVRASGDGLAPNYEVFADGFKGADVIAAAEQATYRPTGLAMDASGALYIGDDSRGRIWRVVYRGP